MPSTVIASRQAPGIVFNRRTADYTLALTDAGNAVEMNVASANNLTVPLNATVAFNIGTSIMVTQYGVGVTTIVATGGVTIRSSNGSLTLNAQYSPATLLKVGTDEWYLFGQIDNPTPSILSVLESARTNLYYQGFF